MIIEALISMLAALVSFIGSLFPDIETPGWMTSIAGHVSTVTGLMAPLGNWVPFGAAGNAVALVLVAIGAAAAVRLIRVLVSLFTGGGGSAA